MHDLDVRYEAARALVLIALACRTLGDEARAATGHIPSR